MDKALSASATTQHFKTLNAVERMAPISLFLSEFADLIKSEPCFLTGNGESLSMAELRGIARCSAAWEGDISLRRSC